MLLVRTFIGASSIHGNGVFAVDEIARGTVVWRYNFRFDRVISDEELAGMPDAFCDYINMYSYRSSDIGGRLLLPCDHAKFLNHSTEPNTIELPLKSVASRKINSGEEITCDYSKFCVDWTGFD